MISSRSSCQSAGSGQRAVYLSSSSLVCDPGSGLTLQRSSNNSFQTNLRVSRKESAMQPGVIICKAWRRGARDADTTSRCRRRRAPAHLALRSGTAHARPHSMPHGRARRRPSVDQLGTTKIDAPHHRPRPASRARSPIAIANPIGTITYPAVHCAVGARR